MAGLIFQQLKDANALPSPTGVALELLRLASDPKAKLEAVGRVVESDPAFAGRLLKLVNSPFAGVSRRVASISLAVRLLGLRIVKNLALGLSLVSSNRQGRCRSFCYEDFWSRSLARAVAAREIAARQKDFPAEEAFMTGLLAEVGLLALATGYPLELACILDATDSHDEAALLAAERAEFGADHYELSADIMSGWYVQDLFCDAVRAQSPWPELPPGHAPRAAQLGRVVHLAGTYARMLTDRQAPPDTVTRLTDEAGVLGLDEEVTLQIFAAAAADWQEAGRVFSISTRAACTFEELRSQAEVAASAPPDEMSLPALRAPEPPRTERLRVLIVDDDEASLRLLERHLSRAGYEVLVAHNGAEALEIERASAPPMIITDWMMAGIDGIELCRRLRHHEHAGFVYIIMLTAGLEANRAVEALEAGADDFLNKPYNHQELLARVRAGERIVRLEASVAERSREIAVFNTRLTEANEQLRVVATTDPLTGLPNRREAMTRLAEYWSLAERHGGPLACIVADIDHFKLFNDRHGHAVGDAVLRAAADVLLQTRRTGEAVYRVGGEEFLIICPRADREAARIAAERARAAVAARSVNGSGTPLSVTLSLGVAERTADMREAGDLLRAADEAMYAAKNAGRNLVRVAGDLASACFPAKVACENTNALTSTPALTANCPQLLQAAFDLLAAKDVNATGACIVATAARLARCRRAILLVPDSSCRTLVVAQCIGLEAAAAASIRVAVGEGLIGRVYATGASLVLHRPDDEPPLAPGEHATALRSPMICRPLVAGGQVHAVLHLGDPEGMRIFPEAAVEAIDVLAPMAGLALQRVATCRPALAQAAIS